MRVKERRTTEIAATNELAIRADVGASWRAWVAADESGDEVASILAHAVLSEALSRLPRHVAYQVADRTIIVRGKGRSFREYLVETAGPDAIRPRNFF